MQTQKFDNRRLTHKQFDIEIVDQDKTEELKFEEIMIKDKLKKIDTFDQLSSVDYDVGDEDPKVIMPESP